MSNNIPIFIPPDICTTNDDYLKCIENISQKDCDSIKNSINTFITSKNPSDLTTFKEELKQSDLKKFLTNTSDKINNVFDNMSCIIENINSNSVLNLNDDEKIKPTDETRLKYNFIKDVIGDNKELKSKLFDNLGGNTLKVINVINMVFFVGFIIFILFLMMRNKK